MLLDQRDKLYQCRLMVAETVIELLLLTTPNRISVTRNRGTKLKFIGYDTLTKDSFAS